VRRAGAAGQRIQPKGRSNETSGQGRATPIVLPDATDDHHQADRGPEPGYDDRRVEAAGNIAFLALEDDQRTVHQHEHEQQQQDGSACKLLNVARELQRYHDNEKHPDGYMGRASCPMAGPDRWSVLVPARGPMISINLVLIMDADYGVIAGFGQPQAVGIVNHRSRETAAHVSEIRA